MEQPKSSNLKPESPEAKTKAENRENALALKQVLQVDQAESIRLQADLPDHPHFVNNKSVVSDEERVKLLRFLKSDSKEKSLEFQNPNELALAVSLIASRITNGNLDLEDPQEREKLARSKTAEALFKKTIERMCKPINLTSLKSELKSYLDKNPPASNLKNKVYELEIALTALTEAKHGQTIKNIIKSELLDLPDNIRYAVNDHLITKGEIGFEEGEEDLTKQGLLVLARGYQFFSELSNRLKDKGITVKENREQITTRSLKELRQYYQTEFAGMTADFNLFKIKFTPTVQQKYKEYLAEVVRATIAEKTVPNAKYAGKITNTGGLIPLGDAQNIYMLQGKFLGEEELSKTTFYQFAKDFGVQLPADYAKHFLV